MSSTYEGAIGRLQEIGGIMNLSQEEIEHLSKCHKVTYSELDVDGVKYPAWRVQHSRALGPGKGGIRFHPDVSEDEVKSLALWMSLKTSLAGLPYGGSKGGIKFNPKEKSLEDLEKISRSYMQAMHSVVGENIDIPAPDVYTNARVMGWMLDEFEQIKGYHEKGMITGKPLELGGIALRGDATSRGGFIVLTDLIEKIGGENSDLKIAIQGFGNVSSFIAQMLEESGCKIRAVSDSKGAIYNEAGLDIEMVLKTKQEKGNVRDYEDAQKITNQELLEMDVDVLILGALENQITKENAGNIKAKYIIELANGPVTPEADKILFNNGIMVVPDILVNSGGVIVSYFEWCQNRAGGVLDEEYLKNKLVIMMKDSWSKVYSLYEEKEKQIDLRSCAYIIAIERILKAEKFRGALK